MINLYEQILFSKFNALIAKIIYLTQLLLISLIALNETKLIRSVSRNSHMFHTLADILIKQISLVVYSDNTSCSVLLLQKFQPKKTAISCNESVTIFRPRMPFVLMQLRAEGSINTGTRGRQMLPRA